MPWPKATTVCDEERVSGKQHQDDATAEGVNDLTVAIVNRLDRSKSSDVIYVTALACGEPTEQIRMTLPQWVAGKLTWIR
jgi:hypothetical protein